MKAFFILIALIGVFALPNFGQFPLASRVRLGNATLFYFGEEDDAALQEITGSLGSDELAQMNLVLWVLDANDSDADSVRRELKLKPGSTWALANRKGFLLAEGVKAPNAQTLAKVLEENGIRNPIKVMKDFIRSNPDHLNARAQLLSSLRRAAILRTIDILQLYRENDNADNSSRTDQNNMPEHLYRFMSRRLNINLLPLQDAQLEEQDDLKIWGEYAKEIEYLFRTGEWRLAFSIRRDDAPAEACSLIMKALYRSLLPQVEQALLERPSVEWQWVTYAWMRSIVGAKDPIKSVLDSMAPSPSKKDDWPPEVVFDLFGQEAKEHGRWGDYADLLWSRLDEVIFNLSQDFINAAMDRERGIVGPIDQGPVYRRDFIDPLLESLIRVSRIEDAEKVIVSVARFPNSRNLPKTAAIIAEKCGRADLAARWANLEVPPRPNGKTLEDLEAFIYRGTKYRPGLFLINGNINGRIPGITILASPDIDSIVGSATGLEGWEIDVTILDRDMSALMLKRENWYGQEFRWALINSDRKILASSTDHPTKETLVDALVAARIKSEPDKLKQFVREHPDHLEAKEELAHWLKKDAILKTTKIFRESQDTEKTTLTSDEDYMIWNEYATIFKQVANYYSNNPPNIVTYMEAVQNDEALRRSPIMAALAKELLPIFALGISKMPTNNGFWTMWASLSDAKSSSQFTNLMETIKMPSYSPRDVRSYLPPDPPTSLEILTERYRLNGNWQGIVNIFGDFLEDQQLMADTPDYTFPRMYRVVINSTLLLEAYMNLEMEGKVNELLKVWRQSSTWKRDEIIVKKLFQKYGRTL